MLIFFLFESNKENDLFFPEPSIAQSRKRRRPRALSGQPKAKRFLPLTTKKERIQPGTFQHQYLVKSQPHFNEVTLSFLGEISLEGKKRKSST